jgi:hypothetical protein
MGNLLIYSAADCHWWDPARGASSELLRNSARSRALRAGSPYLITVAGDARRRSASAFNLRPPLQNGNGNL